jgi:hypothetical protein
LRQSARFRWTVIFYKSLNIQKMESACFKIINILIRDILHFVPIFALSFFFGTT